MSYKITGNMNAKEAHSLEAKDDRSAAETYYRYVLQA